MLPAAMPLLLLGLGGLGVAARRKKPHKQYHIAIKRAAFAARFLWLCNFCGLRGRPAVKAAPMRRIRALPRAILAWRAAVSLENLWCG
ncbi:MAG: VPLPA-CTERM sorting domain-containing protein [Paracoccaceae bacterium]